MSKILIVFNIIFDFDYLLLFFLSHKAIVKVFAKYKQKNKKFLNQQAKANSVTAAGLGLAFLFKLVAIVKTIALLVSSKSAAVVGTNPALAIAFGFIIFVFAAFSLVLLVSTVIFGENLVKILHISRFWLIVPGF